MIIKQQLFLKIKHSVLIYIFILVFTASVYQFCYINKNIQTRKEMRHSLAKRCNQLLKAIAILQENKAQLKDIDKQYETNFHLSGADFNSCVLFHLEAAHQRFYISSVWNRPEASDTDDITLVTQMSASRIETFIYLAQQWTGKIAVSVYGSIADFEKITQSLQMTPGICERKNIYMNLMVKSGNLYPVNHLRNLAWNLVKTSHVFLIDIDFIPQKNSYETLIKKFKQGNSPSDKQILVLPAFEFMTHPSGFYPETKSELHELYRKGHIKMFHEYFPVAHTPTNYTKWFSTDKAYTIEWKMRFEPYIVGRTETMPKYSERFIGRILNKVHQINVMHKMGFEFIVTPDMFLIHVPHPLIEKPNNEYIRCVRIMYHNLIKEIPDNISTIASRNYQ